MLIKTYELTADDFSKAGSISSDIRKIAKGYGMSQETIRRVAVACYEAEINMIIHSHGGLVELSIDDEWLNISFKDVGPGIENIELAMKPGWSTADAVAQNMGFGAGLGLPNIKKNSDTFNLISDPNGTLLQLGFKRKDTL